MKTNTHPRTLILIALLWLPTLSLSYPGESISRDPATGDYIITYWNSSMEPPGLETTYFVPSTKIDPELRSRFYADGKGTITYRYAIRNGSQAKQILGLIILDPVTSVVGTQDDSKMGLDGPANVAASMTIFKANKAALSSPSGWNGSVAFGVSIEETVRIGWGSSSEFSTGIKPGNKVQGFGYSSVALPGIITAELSGDAPVHGWSGEGPDETSAIYAQIEQVRMNDFVPHPAAVPTIAVPTPFDPAILLDRIRTEMQTWPSKQLLDPAYAAQLDRYMVAAAEAYRLNNAKAGKEHIKTIRKMLAKEHHNLDHDDEGDEDTEEHKTTTRFTIERLAARVLNFDLRYVLKRMEPEDGEAHH